MFNFVLSIGEILESKLSVVLVYLDFVCFWMYCDFFSLGVGDLNVRGFD